MAGGGRGRGGVQPLRRHAIIHKLASANMLIQAGATLGSTLPLFCFSFSGPPPQDAGEENAAREREEEVEEGGDNETLSRRWPQPRWNRRAVNTHSRG